MGKSIISFIQVFQAETGKLLRNKHIWLLFVILFLLNGVILFVKTDRADISPVEYRKLKEQVLKLPSQEQRQMLEEQAEQDAFMMDSWDGTYKDTPASKLLSEWETADEYQDYLEKIQKEALNNQAVAIFKTSRFATANLKKTAEDYLPMGSVQPSFVGGYGIVSLLSDVVTNICLIFFMAVLVVYSLLEEKKTGVMELYQSTPCGRAELCLAKMSGIILFAGGITAAFFLFNLLYALYAYGAVDFSAAVQSLPGLEQSIWRISIGQFLVLYLLFKWSVLIVIGLMMFVLAAFIRNEIFYYVVLGLIFFTELLIYEIGYHIGALSFFQYFNLFFFLKSESFFFYHNYDFFGMPLHMSETNIICMVILCILLVLSGVVGFVKYACNYKALSFKQLFVRKHFSSALWNLESYKILYGNKVALFLVVLGLLQVMSYYEKTAGFSTEEWSYRYYIKQIEGEVTIEKLDYMKKEKQRYEELEAQCRALENRLELGDITEGAYDMEMQQLSSELEMKPGFDLAWEYVEYIEKLDREDKEFVYDRGFRYLAGSGDFETDIKNACLAVISMILILSGIIAQEYQYRMQALIHTGKEKDKSLLFKIGIAVLLISVVYLIVYIPEFLWVLKEYGLKGGDCPSCCLMFMPDKLAEIRIAQYFVLMYITRYVTMILIGACIILLGKALKNVNLAMIFGALLFMLPLLLHMAGADFVDAFSFNRLLSGNMVFLK